MVRGELAQQIQAAVDQAGILGLGLRGRGETISVVEVDGEEQLFYSGYLMKKLEQEVVQPAPMDAAVNVVFSMMGQ